MTSGSVEVFGYDVWYEKFGTGKHPILLIPGAIGTGRTDFLEQIEGPHALDLKKYTLIAVEPLGWGRSRPPLRTYNNEIYKKDAQCFAQVMQKLGYSLYSVMSWSDGSRTALLMAGTYPSRVICCIVWGVATYVREQDIKAMSMTKNIKFWEQKLVENYERVYGSEWINLWTRHMDFIERIGDIFPDGIAKNYLKNIRCPVFVLHGDQDPMVDLEHPLFVTKSISDTRLHRFAKAAHNLHFTHALQFKLLVEDSITETPTFKISISKLGHRDY